MSEDKPIVRYVREAKTDDEHGELMFTQKYFDSLTRRTQKKHIKKDNGQLAYVSYMSDGVPHYTDLVDPDDPKPYIAFKESDDNKKDIQEEFAQGLDVQQSEVPVKEGKKEGKTKLMDINDYIDTDEYFKTTPVGFKVYYLNIIEPDTVINDEYNGRTLQNWYALSTTLRQKYVDSLENGNTWSLPTTKELKELDYKSHDSKLSQPVRDRLAEGKKEISENPFDVDTYIRTNKFFKGVPPVFIMFYRMNITPLTVIDKVFNKYVLNKWNDLDKKEAAYYYELVKLSPPTVIPKETIKKNPVVKKEKPTVAVSKEKVATNALHDKWNNSMKEDEFFDDKPEDFKNFFKTSVTEFSRGGADIVIDDELKESVLRQWNEKQKTKKKKTSKGTLSGINLFVREVMPSIMSRKAEDPAINALCMAQQLWRDESSESKEQYKERAKNMPTKSVSNKITPDKSVSHKKTTDRNTKLTDTGTGGIQDSDKFKEEVLTLLLHIVNMLEEQKGVMNVIPASAPSKASRVTAQSKTKLNKLNKPPTRKEVKVPLYVPPESSEEEDNSTTEDDSEEDSVTLTKAEDRASMPFTMRPDGNSNSDITKKITDSKNKPSRVSSKTYAPFIERGTGRVLFNTKTVQKEQDESQDKIAGLLADLKKTERKTEALTKEERIITLHAKINSARPQEQAVTPDMMSGILTKMKKKEEMTERETEEDYTLVRKDKPNSRLVTPTPTKTLKKGLQTETIEEGNPVEDLARHNDSKTKGLLKRAAMASPTVYPKAAREEPKPVFTRTELTPMELKVIERLKINETEEGLATVINNYTGTPEGFDDTFFTGIGGFFNRRLNVWVFSDYNKNSLNDLLNVISDTGFY